jgi:hypothetical protein
MGHPASAVGFVLSHPDLWGLKGWATCHPRKGWGTRRDWLRMGLAFVVSRPLCKVRSKDGHPGPATF